VNPELVKEKLKEGGITSATKLLRDEWGCFSGTLQALRRVSCRKHEKEQGLALPPRGNGTVGPIQGKGRHVKAIQGIVQS